MSISKRNKTFARLVVAAGTLLAGLGIWTAVSGHALPAASTSSNSNSNATFGPSDGFLTQSAGQALSPAQNGLSSQSTTRTARLRTRGS